MYVETPSIRWVTRNMKVFQGTVRRALEFDVDQVDEKNRRRSHQLRQGRGRHSSGLRARLLWSLAKLLRAALNWRFHNGPTGGYGQCLPRFSRGRMLKCCGTLRRFPRGQQLRTRV